MGFMQLVFSVWVRNFCFMYPVLCNQLMGWCQAAHPQRRTLHGNANQWILIDVIDQVCLNRCFVLYRYKNSNTMNIHISFTMMSHPFLSDPGSGPISLDTVCGILEFCATG
jgi:hypothetical protein